MHPLLIIFVGFICGWAAQRRNKPDTLRKWRPVVAAVAASAPYVDGIISLFGCVPCQNFQYSWTWSIFAAPLWALLVAWGFGRFLKQPWKDLYIPALLGVAFTLILGFFTDEGIRLLSPLWDKRFAANIIFSFDLIICGFSLVVVAFCLLLPWKRDIARVGLVLMLIYVGVVATFQEKAQDFAANYAQTLGLDVARIYALPQPISPFNWRLIVITADHKLHDTLVHLYREEEWQAGEKARRSARIQTLYKPLNQAVWRVYRRFGNVNPDGVQKVWESIDARAFRWNSRFAVYSNLVEYDNKACVRFQDIRFIGARNDKGGVLLVCAGENDETYIYKSNNRGTMARIAASK